jgi:16S rRNA (adenine1518-N6/adenine1519-N6)-dimethyltransferase
MFIEDTNFLDQHFLIDQDVKSQFLNAIDVDNNDTIVEIGPGKGTITKLLVPYAKKVTVIELDKRLAPYLESIPNINIIYGSCLEMEIPACDKIVTSLPYSITEPFIYKLINTDFKELIMICGKRYADSVMKQEESKLSLLTNLFFEMTYIMDIEPNSFRPSPRVMSSLVTLKPLSENKLSKSNLIMRYLFSYRLLKVKNALKEILIKTDKITQREAKNLIAQLNIKEDISNKKFDELNNEEVKTLKKDIEEYFNARSKI